MYASDIEGVEFAAYPLKKVAFKWYDGWEVFRGENVKTLVWEEFFDAFRDHFSP